MPDCKAYLREMEGAAEGFAPTGGARAHAEACGACGRRLRETEALRGLVRGLGKVEAPADFDFRLRARIAAAGGAGRRGPFGGLRSALRLAPVAAAACFLFVSASLYIWQSSRTTQTPGTRAGSNEAAGGAGRAQSQGARAPQAEPSRGGESLVTGSQVASVTNPTEAFDSRPKVGAHPQPPRHEGRVQRAAFTRRPKAPAPKAAPGAAPAFGSTVASLNSAEVIRNRTLTIPLETAAAPLRLVLRDEQGAERVVPVRAVSFGAQDLIGREGARRQTTGTNDEGVW